jgi:hypothetical protein
MKDRTGVRRSPWFRRISPSNQLFEMAVSRYEYFIIAAATWCCLDDSSARLAAMVAASLTSPGAQELMLKYLGSVAPLLEESQQKKATSLISAIEPRCSADQKQFLRSELRRADREYYDALVGWYANPDVFIKRHPDIKELRRELPEWLLDELRSIRS